MEITLILLIVVAVISLLSIIANIALLIANMKLYTEYFKDRSANSRIK